VGIESTVLDVSSDQPVILRPGEVTREQIEAVIGPVRVFSGSVGIDQAGIAPGMLAAHYQPRAPMHRSEIGEAGKWVEWRRRNPGERAVVLVIRGTALEFAFGDTTIVEMSDHPPEYARALYSALHNADAQGAGVIWAEMPPEEPRWAAVRDRLMRASSDVKV
jgi:L-threonylcarbamoyladenylate synthase